MQPCSHKKDQNSHSIEKKKPTKTGKKSQENHYTKFKLLWRQETVVAYLDVLPGVHDLHGRVAAEAHVTPPGVEVGGVRLHVLGGGSGAVRVEDELVGGEEEAADRTLDALGSRGVVPIHHHYQRHQQLIINIINNSSSPSTTTSTSSTT